MCNSIPPFLKEMCSECRNVVIYLIKNRATDGIKVMTLNVNGFRGCTKALSVSNEICIEHMKQIKGLIDNVICNKIIILLRKDGFYDYNF